MENIQSIRGNNFLVQNNEVFIAINCCCGGFSLSEVATDLLKKTSSDVELLDYIDEDIKRHDPDLIKVIRQLGKKANDTCSDLRIVKIPIEAVYADAFQISDYDGSESVEVNHERIALYYLINSIKSIEDLDMKRLNDKFFKDITTSEEDVEKMSKHDYFEKLPSFDTRQNYFQ